MNKIQIFDTTLRDGAQTAFIGIGPEDRYLIARALAYTGVDVIEAGFAANTIDYLTLRVISEKIGNSDNSPVICSLARALPGDVELAYQSVQPARPDKRRIHVFIGTSEELLEHSIEKPKTEVLKMIGDNVRKARELLGEQGQVQYSSEDAIRAMRTPEGKEWLAKTIEVAIEAGADVINIPDTTGSATPREYYDAIKYLKQNVERIDKVVLSVHPHNDFGNAVPVALSGLEAGVTQVEGCVNQLGERAGNVDWPTVVANLKWGGYQNLIDVDHIKTTEFKDLSNLVKAAIGTNRMLNHPLVGDSAFAQSSGIHVKGILRNPNTYVIIPPEAVGRKIEVVLGQTSGMHTVYNFLKNNGYGEVDCDYSEKQIVLMTDAVKRMSMKNRSSLTHTESKLLAEHYIKCQPLHPRISLVHWQSIDQMYGRPEFEVAAVVDGKLKQGRGQGEGPVDGFINAMVDATGITVDGLVDWQEMPQFFGFGAKGYEMLQKLGLTDSEKMMLGLSNGVSRGQEAPAHSIVEIAKGRETYCCRGFSPKITEASYNAIATTFDAMHRLE
ncbi:MAG: hypothetical protein KJ922_01310 [Nanoarchaeota archaeon]|nr:hypothetical protein [Nanoarchaeota archaeon]MBU1703982.1 hypothetical protein [Nanoarchaeota archaeon]